MVILVTVTLCEYCPNTEFFLVRIFPYLDLIQRFTRTRKTSLFGDFSRGVTDTKY